MSTRNIFTLSEKAKMEYCATVVRVGKVIPIEGSDFLGQTFVNNFSIVIRKDEVKEGDCLIYCANETQLCEGFLSSNNLYELSERKRNSNFKEVQSLVDEGKTDDAKKLTGFFNKHGRVKMIKLRGVPSMGFLFGVDSLSKWIPKLKDIDLSEFVGTDFDTIDGRHFINAYVPYVPEPRSMRGNGKRDRKLKMFDRMISGQFMFHYDTAQLQRNIHHIKPDDTITVDLKEHGTSFIIANVKVKNPKKLTSVQRLINKSLDKEISRCRRRSSKRYDEKDACLSKIGRLVKRKTPTYTINYGNVYSSRTVIKNKEINDKVNKGFYEVDVWGVYNELMKPYIPKGMTLYGEILGYLPNSRSMIQKSYDYGCAEGESYLLPYRITTEREDGTKKEWEKIDVEKWTLKLIKDNPVLRDKVKPVKILYHGLARELYADIDTDSHWHENFLERLRNDKERFGMEENEPYCKNKVPREGIILRIDNDEDARAFKLKCMNFLLNEGKNIDKGQVDIEMSQTDYC